MSLQLLSFQWRSRKTKWHQPQCPGIMVLPLLSGFSGLAKRQRSGFHRSVLSPLVHAYWRRPGSSCRRKCYGCRASSWRRRRNVSSMKRWSGGCRNECCCSPRWVSRSCLGKPVTLLLSSRCTPCCFFSVHLCNWYYRGATGSLLSVCCERYETCLYDCVKVLLHLRALLVFPSRGAHAVWELRDLVSGLAFVQGQRIESCCRQSVWSH